MNLSKYDYVPDPGHTMIKAATLADKHLSALCPHMVGQVRAMVSRDSSASLVVGVENGTKLLEIAMIIPMKFLPPDLQEQVVATRLLTAVAISELAVRYRAGTLDPIFHDGDAISVAQAKLAVDIETANAAAAANGLEDKLLAAG